MKYIPTVFAIFLCFSCMHSVDYTIEKKTIVLLDSAGCKAVSSYPVFHFKSPKAHAAETNKFLSLLNDMDRYAKKIDAYFPDSIRNKIVTGDYKILFTSDTLVNIELTVKFEGRKRIIYHNLSVDLLTGELINYPFDPSRFDRGKLYPYVYRFNEQAKAGINLETYKSNARQMIMFGRTEKDMVLYLGGEGEFEGYHKILIPLKDIL